MAIQTVDTSRHLDRRSRRWRFSTDQYLAMVDSGVLPPDARTELIAGEVYTAPPPRSLHASSKTTLLYALLPGVGDRALVWVDDAVRLGDDSVVQPDLALLRPDHDRYGNALPIAADVLLAIEVAMSSRDHDRRRKIPLYARHGVPEVWLVDLVARRLEVYRDPRGGRYRASTVLADGDTIAPSCAPAVAVDVGDVLRVRLGGGVT